MPVAGAGEEKGHNVLGRQQLAAGIEEAGHRPPLLPVWAHWVSGTVDPPAPGNRERGSKAPRLASSFPLGRPPHPRIRSYLSPQARFTGTHQHC